MLAQQNNHEKWWKKAVEHKSTIGNKCSVISRIVEAKNEAWILSHCFLSEHTAAKNGTYTANDD